MYKTREGLLIIGTFIGSFYIFQLLRNEFKLIKTLISCELIAKITCIREIIKHSNYIPKCKENIKETHIFAFGTNSSKFGVIFFKKN